MEREEIEIERGFLAVQVPTLGSKEAGVPGSRVIKIRQLE